MIGCWKRPLTSFSYRQSPCRLTISAARTNVARLIRRAVRPQCTHHGLKPVLAGSGRAVSTCYASGFFSAAASLYGKGRVLARQGQGRVQLTFSSIR